MDDSKIIQLYHQRNEQAISETDAKYGAYCRAIAYRILYSTEDTEECVNDTWLKTWNSIPPQMPKSLQTYLACIVRNLAFDRYRMKAREKRGGGEVDLALEELEQCADRLADVEAEYQLQELGEAINRFLHKLHRRDRDIFVARYYFVCPVAEIASKLGMHTNYVHNILSRTRKKLKVYLEKEGFTL